MSPRIAVLTALTTLVSACASAESPPSGPASLRVVPPSYYSYSLRRYVPWPTAVAVPRPESSLPTTPPDSRQLDDAADKLNALQRRLNHPVDHAPHAQE